MDSKIYIDHYLEHKRWQRLQVFQDAASTSLLMHGVKFLCMHFYHLLDWYCRRYMSVRLRLQAGRSSTDVFEGMGKLHADAIDTYHVLWVLATFLCYAIGWELYYLPGDTTKEWLYWIVPLLLCLYRIFEILAALVEMYFRASESRHHQFRILLHSGLHYLATGFSCALFFVFTDWACKSFSIVNDAGTPKSQFHEFFDPINYSLLTVFYFGANEVPQDWIGKLLTILELLIGLILITFIFLNITEVWYGDRKGRD